MTSISADSAPTAGGITANVDESCRLTPALETEVGGAMGGAVDEDEDSNC